MIWNWWLEQLILADFLQGMVLTVNLKGDRIELRKTPCCEKKKKKKKKKSYS